MPFGGKYQLTPAQTMVQKVSVQEKETDTVSLMAYGFNPYISGKSPYHLCLHISKDRYVLYVSLNNIHF